MVQEQVILGNDWNNSRSYPHRGRGPDWRPSLAFDDRVALHLCSGLVVGRICIRDPRRSVASYHHGQSNNGSSTSVLTFLHEAGWVFTSYRRGSPPGDKELIG